MSPISTGQSALACLRGNKAKAICVGAKVKDSILLVLSLLQND